MIQSKLGAVGKMPMSTEDKIRHYQRSIDRSIHDHARLLHCIEVLSKLSVTVQHLQITGIGRTVNALRKIENGVGDAAKSLVAKWKYMVANTDSSGEEDEACVPDVPESYESPDESYSQQEESSKDILENSEDQYESTSNFKDSRSSEVSDHKRKDKSKSKSESSPSSSTSNRDKKSLEEKKRKYDSNSSDGETERKKQRISRSEEDEDEDEDEEKEEDNFVINETLDSSEEEKTEEEKVSKKSRDKESSLNVTNNSDKTKSKDKHRSSNSKTKSRESGDKSKRDDKSSSSKSDERGKEEKHKSSEHRSKDSSKSKTSHSSSSSKDHSKDKDRHKDKDNYSKEKGKEKESSSKSRKDDKEKSSSKDFKDDKGKSKEVKEIKDHKKHKENKEHKEQKEQKENKEDKDQKELKKDKKKTKKSSNEGDGGIDCNSGTSFADALGMCTMPLPLKKKKENTSISLPKDSNVEKSEKLDKPITSSSTPSTPSTSKSSPVVTKNEPSDSPESLHLLSPNLKLEPLSRAINEEVDLASTLPEPSPNYKPLPYMNSAQRRQNEDHMLSQVIYAKNQRTKVYSGNKTGYTTVPTLYEMCIRILIENIDALEVTGGVPYYIIKPVLERASPEQLFMLEHHNPYLMEDSDSLWQFHCNKDFRTKQRQEMESWREMYMRCLDEREAKLKALTANIKQSIDKSAPVRSTKLAYVDNIVKPPRSVLRKQAKYGTANATSKASDAKQKLIAAASGAGTSSASSSTERISVPPPPISRMRTNPAHALKKAKAPLMAKALQAIKGRYRR